MGGMLRSVKFGRKNTISSRIKENQGKRWSSRPDAATRWNVMAHAQKPDFVFRRNGQVHLNRRGRQFSRLLVAEVWASAVVMLDTTRSEVVWRVPATHSIRQFPLHFPSRAAPCAITFQLEATTFTNAPNARHQTRLPAAIAACATVLIFKVYRYVLLSISFTKTCRG
jgi:hypothetical protein